MHIYFTCRVQTTLVRISFRVFGRLGRLDNNKRLSFERNKILLEFRVLRDGETLITALLLLHHERV